MNKLSDHKVNLVEDPEFREKWESKKNKNLMSIYN
jgi:hypothetical protein